MKGVLKYMAEGKKLLETLITDKKSFAKRATHSCATRSAHAWCGGLASQGRPLLVAQQSRSVPGGTPRSSRSMHCSMTELRVGGNRSLTNAAIIAIADHCRNLTQLDVEGCHSLTDAAIIAIADRCPNFAHLVVVRCDKLTNAAIIQ